MGSEGDDDKQDIEDIVDLRGMEKIRGETNYERCRGGSREIWRDVEKWE